MSVVGVLFVVPVVALALFLVVFAGGGAVVGKVFGLGALRGLGLGGVAGGFVLTVGGLGLAASFQETFERLVKAGVLSIGRPEHITQGLGAIVWTGCFLAGLGFVTGVSGMFVARGGSRA